MAIAASQTPGRRARSAGKQAAILDAAESLFVRDGYERTSVDAIAAAANVSKRTVYDHFGGKAALHGRVLHRVHDALTVTVRTALDEELTPGRELRAALVAFALRVTTETFPSSAYVTYRRLTTQDPAAPPRPEHVRDHPERLLADRFARLADAGELRAADPRRAARHFTALTMLLALDALDGRTRDAAGTAEIRAIVDTGVDAFLRAYR
jgi:TetR/AcrR family transcriptional repressor of mexJK operon